MLARQRTIGVGAHNRKNSCSVINVNVVVVVVANASVIIVSTGIVTTVIVVLSSSLLRL